MYDKGKKIKQKFEVGALVRTAELKKTFSKGDATNWSYNMYGNTEVINDTIASYRIDDLPDCYFEALLETTK